MPNSNEYIKVIGITAALLVFGLINSVSAIVSPESRDFKSSAKISIYPDSVNGSDIQSAFTFEPSNNVNLNIIFPGAMAEQGQAISYPSIELAPTSALSLGYDLGLQGMANIRWQDINSDAMIGRSVMLDGVNERVLGGRSDIKVHDPAVSSIITEWPSNIPVSRSVPDPATLVFFGLGLVGIGVVRWKKVFVKKAVFKST